MGRKIDLVFGQAHLEESKIFGGVQRFRWRCNCIVQDAAWTQRLSSKDPWTTLEAFRQHWGAKHPSDINQLVNWSHIHRQVPWLMDGTERDDDGRFWVAPSGKRPAVASDYRKTEAFSAMDYFMGSEIEEEKKGMSRLSDIEARMRELEKEAAKYARFPKTDEWPVGTVIAYVWTSPNADAEVYTYAVLKATAIEWYWTGAWRQSIKHGRYDALVEALADENVSNIRVATPEDFDPLFPELEDLVGLEDTKTVEEVSEKLADKGIYVPVVKRADG